MFFNKIKFLLNKGFSMLELLLIISIFTIISSIVLVNYTRFDSGILIENLAYRIALTVRQAQSYGLFVKSGGVTTGFNIGYGIRFDKDTPNSFILFTDSNKNSKYDGTSEFLEIFNLQQGNRIQRFCGVFSGNLEECSPDIDYLDISFLRPNPEAIILSSARIDVANQYQTAVIRIISSKGLTREINIGATGQIYVK